jgi:hypothetical protein
LKAVIAKAVFHLHDLSSPQRLDIAADQLQSGLGFVYQDTWFIHESGRLWCNAIHPGSHAAAQREDESTARGRMEACRHTLDELCAAHPMIAHLASQLATSFAVVEDYGQGVAPLWCLIDGRILTGNEAWRVWPRT